MKRVLHAGFTLIELVVVIVILGILAAVAIPQFVDLSSEARTAVGQSACGALQSAAVMQYASNRASSTYATLTAAVTVTGGAFGGSCGSPTFTPTGGSAVSCTVLASQFCSG